MESTAQSVLLGEARNAPAEMTLIAGLLHLVTSPVGSNLLTRATYFAEGIDHHNDTVDELSELSRHRAGRPPRP